jgi:hypothetical protein
MRFVRPVYYITRLMFTAKSVFTKFACMGFSEVHVCRSSERKLRKVLEDFARNVCRNVW